MKVILSIQAIKENGEQETDQNSDENNETMYTHLHIECDSLKISMKIFKIYFYIFLSRKKKYEE